MSSWWKRFEQYLATDPGDIGCDETMEMLHVYVDLLMQGIDAAERYPGLAVHLESCDGCKEDVRGLLSAVEEVDASLIVDEKAKPMLPPTLLE